MRSRLPQLIGIRCTGSAVRLSMDLFAASTTANESDAAASDATVLADDQLNRNASAWEMNIASFVAAGSALSSLAPLN